MEEFAGTVFDFRSVVSRFPVLGEAYFYAVAVPVALIALYYGRYLIRRAITNRVRSIDVSSAGFGDLDVLKKKLLVTDDEYRLMRKKVAERQLEEMRERERLMKEDPRKFLAALEVNPDLVAQLRGSDDARVRAALDGLGKRHSDDELEEWRKAKPTAYDYGRGEPTPRPKPTVDPDAIVPGDPLSDPRFVAAPREAAPPPGADEVAASVESISPEPSATPTVPPPTPTPRSPLATDPPPGDAAPPRAAKSRSRDLDLMLERGIIGRAEYDRLTSLLDGR